MAEQLSSDEIAEVLAAPGIWFSFSERAILTLLRSHSRIETAERLRVSPARVYDVEDKARRKLAELREPGLSNGE